MPFHRRCRNHFGDQEVRRCQDAAPEGEVTLEEIAHSGGLARDGMLSRRQQVQLLDLDRMLIAGHRRARIAWNRLPPLPDGEHPAVPMEEPLLRPQPLREGIGVCVQRRQARCRFDACRSDGGHVLCTCRAIIRVHAWKPGGSLLTGCHDKTLQPRLALRTQRNGIVIPLRRQAQSWTWPFATSGTFGRSLSLATNLSSHAESGSSFQLTITRGRYATTTSVISTPKAQAPARIMRAASISSSLESPQPPLAGAR